MLSNLLRANASKLESLTRWEGDPWVNGREQDKTRWIGHGFQLGVLSALDGVRLDSLLDCPAENSRRLDLILRAGQAEFIEGK